MNYISRKKFDPTLLSNKDRVFQLDRDTFLIFTTLFSEEDNKVNGETEKKVNFPAFVKVGSSDKNLTKLAPFISDVVLPELHLPNLAFEYKEIKNREVLGIQNSYNYRGSKKFNKLLSYYLDGVHKNFRYFRSYSAKKKVRELEQKPKNYALIDYLSSNQLEKILDHVFCTFYTNGDISISLNAKKIFHFSKAYTSPLNLNIDQEYELMQTCINRIGTKMNDSDSRSFIWFGTENSLSADQPFLYWNHEGHSLLCHPIADYHHILFKHQINPNLPEAVLAESAYSPGLVEFIRNKNRKGQEAKLLLSDSNKLSALHHFYDKTDISIWEDTSSAFKDTVCNAHLSQCHENVALSWPFSTSSHKLVQILLPLKENKGENLRIYEKSSKKNNKRKKFQLIRSPHALELEVLHSYKDASLKNALLSFHIPGKINKLLFSMLRLNIARYPLLANKEYFIYESEIAEDFFDKFLSIFKSTPYEKEIHKTLLLHSHKYFDIKKVRKQMQKFSLLKIDRKDIKARNNLRHFLFFIKNLKTTMHYYEKEDHLKLKKLLHKFSINSLAYADWLNLKDEDVEFLVFILGNKSTFLFVQDKESKNFNFSLPPEPLYKDASLKKHLVSYTNVQRNLNIQNTHAKLLHYQFFIKTWEKFIDKNNLNQFEPVLDVLKKLYNHKLYIKSQQEKLLQLLQHLNFQSFILPSAIKREKGNTKKSSYSNNYFIISKFLGLRDDLSLTFQNLSTKLVQPFKEIFMKERLASFLNYISLFRHSTIDNYRRLGSKNVLLLSLCLIPIFLSFILLSQGVFSIDRMSWKEKRVIKLVDIGEEQRLVNVPGEEKIQLAFVEVLEYANLLASLNGFNQVNANVKSEEETLRNPNLIFPEDMLRLPDGRLTKIKKGQHLLVISRLHYRKDYARIKILEKQSLAYMKEIKKIKEEDKKKSKMKKLKTKLEMNKKFIKRLAVTKAMKEEFQSFNSKFKEFKI